VVCFCFVCFFFPQGLVAEYQPGKKGVSSVHSLLLTGKDSFQKRMCSLPLAFYSPCYFYLRRMLSRKNITGILVYLGYFSISRNCSKVEFVGSLFL